MSRLFAVLLLTLCMAAPAQARADDPLKSLSWLSGQWIGRDGVTRAEEHFMKPAGGVMLGMRRSLSTSRPVDIEFIRIVAEPDGRIVYYAQPLGSPHVVGFTLVESGDNMVVFANPDHHYPQRIVYNRYGRNVVAAMEGPDGKGGVRRYRWTWRLAGDAP